jgi:hypothetical protein
MDMIVPNDEEGKALGLRQLDAFTSNFRLRSKLQNGIYQKVLLAQAICYGSKKFLRWAADGTLSLPVALQPPPYVNNSRLVAAENWLMAFSRGL